MAGLLGGRGDATDLAVRALSAVQLALARHMPRALDLYQRAASWSLVDYLMALDGATRLAVVASALVLLYISFSVAMRFSRMVLHLLICLLQLALVVATLLVLLQHRQAIGGLLARLHL